ncbi:hypothetical protein [Streptomyces sp. SBT349]|nr:hypothetical protein [Streptomyces sp. SBT349]
MNLAISLEWADDGEDHSDALAAAIGPFMEAYLARLSDGICVTA